jgi:hypothetical protein
MASFMFVEMKKAQPVAIRNKPMRITGKFVWLVIKANNNIPEVARDIPISVRRCGLTLSTNLPARGDKSAWKRGWDTNTKPAL